MSDLADDIPPICDVRGAVLVLGQIPSSGGMAEPGRQAPTSSIFLGTQSSTRTVVAFDDPLTSVIHGDLRIAGRK